MVYYNIYGEFNIRWEREGGLIEGGGDCSHPESPSGGLGFSALLWIRLLLVLGYSIPDSFFNVAIQLKSD